MMKKGLERKVKRISFRVTEKEKEEYSRLAKELELSHSELAMELVRKELEKHEHIKN